MFSALSTRGAMTATTALVAVGLVVMVPDWQKAPDLRLPKPEVSQPASLDAVEEKRAGTAPPADGQRLDQAQTEIAESDDVIAGLADMDAPAEPAPATRLSRERAAAPDAAAQQPEAESFAAGRLQPGVVAPAGGESIVLPETDTEAYPDATPNPLKITAEEPVSTFSIDVDTASYSVVRSSLTNGRLPPDGAVRIEEMINYFPYDYPVPEGDAPFRPTVTIADTPWNPDTRLVHIAIQGEKPAVEDRPPLNLVFLIDTSGSMDAPNKLPLLKQSLALMLPRLGDQDQVAIVTYAGSAGQVLAPTPATERETILNALENLHAGGSTAGQAGLQQAYAVANGMAADGEVTRVILATDGDFNVGMFDPEALKRYIADERESGTYLSVLGFGRGNLDDATMQALAQNGNGQAAYIDTLSEAQKVLVDQFTGALFPIANDVKIQVEFNPAQIAEYRLIGYETRALNREDFNNDRVDAGDIGAGHSVTAIYEVTPVGSPARLSDPLRYQSGDAAAVSDELGFLRLRYKEPGETESRLIETPILPGGEMGEDMLFGVAIAWFGQLLQNSSYLPDDQYDDAIALANRAKGADPFGYRAEAVRLMRLAQSLSRN